MNKSSDHCRSRILINGVQAEYLDVNDRSIHYGDGLFETILLSNGSLFYWQQHYQRLYQSAERLQLHCPNEDTLLNDIHRLLSAVGKTDADSYAVKIIVTRGAGERGYQYDPTACNETRILSLSPVNPDYSSLLSTRLLAGSLTVCRQQVSINENLAGLKHLNRLENVLARNEFNQRKNETFIDGIMLNANQHVIECCMSNIFALKNNTLYTPDLKLSGINGIMRNIIITIANKNNMKVNICNLTLAELMAMQEVFISNSLIGMKSVNRAGDVAFNKQDISAAIFNSLLETMNDYAQAA